MKLVTAAQMRELDRRTIEDLGVPSLVLMENAGRGAYQVLRREFPELGGPVVILAGRGNNGGDGFVVARYLMNDGFPVSVFLLAARDQVRGDALVNLKILEALGVRVEEVQEEGRLNAVVHRMSRAELVVDALLGTGLNSPVQGLLAQLITKMNQVRPGAGGGHPQRLERRHRGASGHGRQGPGHGDLRVSQAGADRAAGP